MSESDCLFCGIARGEVDADLVREDDDVVVFRDINPQAPTHLLVIPREHIPSLDDLDESHGDVIARMHVVAAEVVRDEGLAGNGWRAVINVGEQAGQSVFHLHMHVLGGRAMRWPPG